MRPNRNCGSDSGSGFTDTVDWYNIRTTATTVNKSIKFQSAKQGTVHKINHGRLVLVLEVPEIIDESCTTVVFWHGGPPLVMTNQTGGQAPQKDRPSAKKTGGIELLLGRDTERRGGL